MLSNEYIADRIRSARVKLEIRQKYLDDTQEATLELQQAVSEAAKELDIPHLEKALNGPHITVGSELGIISARLISEIETAIARGLAPHRIKGILLESDTGC